MSLDACTFSSQNSTTQISTEQQFGPTASERENGVESEGRGRGASTEKGQEVWSAAASFPSQQCVPLLLSTETENFLMVERAKLLGEKHIRDKAVDKMKVWLSGGAGDVKVEKGGWEDEAKEGEEARLSKDEMDKVWAGLYYNYWMSDKPLVQQALADSLALLTFAVRPSSTTPVTEARVFRARMAYLRAFWQTLTREWPSLDKHRIDKFYLLVRRFLHVQFIVVQRASHSQHNNSDDNIALAEYKRTLTADRGPLDVADDKVTASLCYHISDIALDELEKSFASPIDGAGNDDSSTKADEEGGSVGIAILDPFIHVLLNAKDKTMFQRVLENVFAALVDAPESYPSLSKRLAAQGGTKEAVLARLFAKASEKDTDDVARKRLYAFCRKYSYPS